MLRQTTDAASTAVVLEVADSRVIAHKITVLFGSAESHRSFYEYDAIAFDEGVRQCDDVIEMGVGRRDADDVRRRHATGSGNTFGGGVDGTSRFRDDDTAGVLRSVGGRQHASLPRDPPQSTSPVDH